MNKYFLIFIATSAVFGCASPQPLPAYIQPIRIFKKTDPPLGCIELGKVMVTGISDGQMEDDLKYKTYMLDGDVVTIDHWEVDSKTALKTARGTAFKCHTAKDASE